MTEFKVGDKVEVVKAYDKNKVGDVGTITSTSESYYFDTFYRINGDRWGAPVYFFKKVEDEPMFKVGDKVKIIGNKNKSVNRVGDIGNIVEKFTDDIWRVSVEGRKQKCNWTKECDMELVKTVEYEDQWHLNDGKVDIPGDADKLEKDGSVVAFRKRKVKDLEFGEKLRIKKSLWRGDVDDIKNINPGLDYVNAVYISKYFDCNNNEGIKVYINDGEKSWECCFLRLDKVERMT